MDGIHIFYPNDNRCFIKWDNESKQYISRADEITYSSYFNDYEIVVQYISTLSWKKYNGRILLYTNKKGYDVFDNLGILYLYDEVNIEVLEEAEREYKIDDKIYWANQKIKVISKLKTPFVMLDLDLYVDTSLKDIGFFENELGILHYESDCVTYPYPRVLPNVNEFKWPDNFNWDSNAVNCALVYFNNQEFLETYTNLSLNFMESSSERTLYDYYTSRMVFAEQRILGELIDKTDISYRLLIRGLFTPQMISDNAYGFVDIKNIRTAYFEEKDNTIHEFTNIKTMEHYVSHLWGYKNKLLNDREMRSSFIKRAVKKIENEYPNELNNVINSIKKWNEYDKHK